MPPPPPSPAQLALPAVASFANYNAPPQVSLPKINLAGFFNSLISIFKRLFGLNPTVAPQPAAVAAPAPAAPVAAVAPPPITVDTVKAAATTYVANHPEIADQPSYVNVAAVAQLREGVIASLIAQGYKAGRILGPDGKPYDQIIAFGNATDALAQVYRVTAGGGSISQAIKAGYTNDPCAWSDVH